jgi:anti-sigma regulatory factor (Ser/Thr protein kinase)
MGLIMHDDSMRTLLKLVSDDGKNVAVRLAAIEKISRQAASARLRAAVAAGFVTKTGVGRGVAYSLAEMSRASEEYTRAGLSEDRVWRSFLAPLVRDLSENVQDIWRYGFTEMVNNAIDHSASDKIKVGCVRDALYTQVWVSDDGEGIFNKIQKALQLYDPREAILELAKGKFTTDPENHSGEGIFFSSKVFDLFEIRSGGLHFMHENERDDQLIERPHHAPGTVVVMRLLNNSPRSLKEVFDQFAAPEEYSFAKTIVPVKLGQYEGEKLVSRSQAKRLIFRFEKFKTVVLDFTGVEEIGQAFSDEVFRVFQKKHPETKLVPVHMTDAVKNMVLRGGFVD